MAHFIKHLAGSEPRTHRGGGKADVRVLLKASTGLRHGAVDGVGSALVWGSAGGSGRVLRRGAVHGRRRRRRGARG